MITRREFLKQSALAAGGTALLGSNFHCGSSKSRVVSVAAEDILANEKYNPKAVHRAFDTGLQEMTGQNSLANAWSSMFSPDDVVGIKINCIGAPRISSSLESINETIAGLKSAGVKENNIIVWDHMDRAFRKTGLKINRTSQGVRIHGTSDKSGVIVPWVDGFDKYVYLSLEDGTSQKFKELVDQNFTENGTHR